MHQDNDLYKNQLDENLAFYDLYLDDYLKRLSFARDNGCNTLMLTGDAEPQQNRRFLVDFGIMMRLLDKPFRNIEMQTTGAAMDEPMLRFLRNHVGVNTVSLSLFALDNEYNHACKGGDTDKRIPPVDIFDFCGKIKKYDFNLRLSLNLTAWFNRYDGEGAVKDLFEFCREKLRADQMTFRVLYAAETADEQSQWVFSNKAEDRVINTINAYITEKGAALHRLEYGNIQYGVHGMSVVLDDDCMGKELSGSYKYLILRQNGKLYSLWDSPASLIF
jgi:hypothetical protein